MHDSILFRFPVAMTVSLFHFPVSSALSVDRVAGQPNSRIFAPESLASFNRLKASPTMASARDLGNEFSCRVLGRHGG
jgi:hypothetical protein